MDPVFLAKGLLDAGGWGAFVILCVICLVAIGVKGWVVPRFVYDQEKARSDRLEGQLQRNTEALEGLRDDIRWNERTASAGRQAARTNDRAARERDADRD